MKRWICLLFIASALPVHVPGAWSHSGHEGPEASAPASGGPQRLTDGSVFLPKPAQRRFAVRTVRAETKQVALSVELNGRVVMDPNAAGRVQATQSGRLQPGPQGLPTLGRAVRRGEVLAYVQPVVSSLERGNQQALLAELRANKAVAEKKLARLAELEGTVPRKEIEQTRYEVEALSERIAAVGGSLSNRDTLVAPVSGVIASANAVSGQMVEARELLFEIVDPQRLMIEAIAYDPALAADIESGSLQLGSGKPVALQLAGVSGSLREQALPVLFRMRPPLPPMALGQSVKVVAQRRSTVSGMPLPASALTRNAANETVAWVHSSAERFTPRLVVVQPLDAARVAVVNGLAAGDRVVVDGAEVLAQIR